MRQSRTVILVIFLEVAGCRTAEERYIPVSGQISVEDQPLPAGRIVFYPDAERGNALRSQPCGVIDEQGGFRMATNGRPGVAPGWYRVAIFALREPEPGAEPAPPEWLASERYSDASLSGLTVHVEEQASEHSFQFTLER